MNGTERDLVWFGKLSSAILGAFALLISILAPQGSAQVSTRSNYIVEFHSGADVDRESKLLQGDGYTVNGIYKMALVGLSVQLPDATAMALLNNPRVKSVYKDERVFKLGIQSPASSWGLDRIDQRSRPLSNSFTFDENAEAVDVYVFDTGLNASLDEFKGRVKPGRNFMSDKVQSDTSDCDGHGTHVSGTIMGAIYGVNRTANVIPVRVLDCNGSGTATAILNGIEWVIAQHGSERAVANMSLGFGGVYSPVDTAVANLVADGVVTVVAAGNSGANACNYTPARASSALTVGSTTSSDARSSFSNFGTCLDLFAPGSSIKSVDHLGNVVSLSGTSMASPHVAGAAALVWASSSTLTASQVVSKLVSDSTSGVLTSIGLGSPNRLLFVPAPTTPPTMNLVTFKFNDGVTPDSSVTVNSGSAITLPSPVREGYSFVGWFTDLTGGTQVASPYVPVSPITLFARWSANSYSISYLGNGNTGGTVPSTGTFTTGGSPYVIESPGSLVRTGFSFNGWNTAADGSGVLFVPGSTYANPASLSLYAMWLEVSGNVPATPGAPVASRALTGGIRVSWVAPDNGGSSLTGFELRMFRNGTLVQTYKYSPSTLVVNLKVKQRGTYQFDLRALNVNGASAYSPFSNSLLIA